VLYGRDVERARIDALLAGPRSSRSGVLVVRGEAGIGKSSLLDHAVAVSGEMPVLRAAGVESESELAFAGLHQLLRPVLGLLNRLPEGQAGALACALGLDGGDVSDRFLVSLGALGLLSEAAEPGGLLCVVDDAQWLDQPSAEALVFVARRLEAEGVVVLVAAREGDGRQFESPGLPELRLEGLPAEPAAALLEERAGPGVSSAVRDRLLALSQGNPLALMELPTALSAEQLAGREPLIEPLPVGEGLERAFLGRIRALDPPAERLMLLAAADEGGELAPVLRAAQMLGVDVEALDRLETSELVRVDGAAITFRHPLVRSAVYRRASFTQREAAHLALAEALPDEADADRRAWHLAAASPGPDVAVADELEHSAVRARLRGGHAAAATALERAAQLSEDDTSRARRLLAAAEANWLGGRAQRAGPLVEQAEHLLTDPELRAQAALLRGSYEFERGRPGDAYDVLVAGAEEALGVDPRMALEMLVRAAEAASFAARMDRSARIAELASGVPATHDEERFMVALLEGTTQLVRGEHEPGVGALERARRLADEFEHPRYLTFAAFADSYLGDFVTGQSRHARAVARLRAAGAVGDLPLALQLLAAAEVWLGRFGAAAANAAEGLRLAAETGQDTNASFELGTLARAEAPQGRETECREHAAEAMELSAGRGLPLPGAVALMGLGVLELGLGRPEEALAHATAITDPSSGLAHPLVAIYTAPDLVEAAVRSGRPDLAGPALERFAAWAERVPTRWPLAATARMRALFAEGEEADEHFDEALRRHADAELPFEHARTRLLYGEHLRRSRRRSDARPHLRAALSGFERLGAQPWAERARGELRATGETARKREPSTIDQLTPQELQIARFVSEGATNREVATKLFLSPRTVEYHLHKVFTKLGIASRGELARLLPQQPAAPEESPAPPAVTSDRA
jgi:DNA-binding CsgD family transcriptional regulator/tetratricopeptide (TPR) repeat protein